MTLWAESKGAQNFLRLVALRKCSLCKHKFDVAILTPTGRPFPENVILSGEWAFHWQDSHGIPPEELANTVANTIYRIDDDF